MDQSDREAIEGLFQRLSRAERAAPPRDAEAERYIAQQMARTPGAGYYLAQTVVVQEAALSRAEEQIAELQCRLAERDRPNGGFLSGLFGDGATGRSTGRRPQPREQAAFGNGSGFLGGAARTAMGVAGGVLIANAIAGLLADDLDLDGPMEATGDDLGGEPGFDDFDI